MTLIRSTSALSAGVVLLLAQWATAQEVKAEATAEVPAAPPEATPNAAPEPVDPPAAEPEPAPEPEPVVAVAVVAEEEVAEEEDTTGVSYLLFADAYASFQTAQPGSPAPGFRAYDSNVNVDGTNTVQDGIALSWLGLDLVWDGGPVGATLNLRGGPGVNLYFVDSRMSGPISFTQAFVTWKPADQLAIDFGIMGTIFGAEVVENWVNFNYTRSALYYQMQPFWHTGVRATYELSDEFSIKGFLADDANHLSLLDSTGANSTMQAAIQVAYAANGVSAALGTMQTLGESSLSGFDRFVDLVLGYSNDKFGVLFNGDLNIGDDAATDFYGLSLAARYFFVPEFGVALRGDFTDANMDVSNDELVTGTLTLDVRPLKGSDSLILRWDNRVESKTGEFTNRAGEVADAWFSSTIGLTAYTSGML